jgi:hypothetical protein
MSDADLTWTLAFFVLGGLIACVLAPSVVLIG